MAQAPETHTAHERRIAALDEEIKQRDHRIAELERKLEQRDRRSTKALKDEIEEEEEGIDEAIHDAREEVNMWASALVGGIEGVVDIYNEYARAWNRGVGEVGAELAQSARRGFRRLARDHT
jgi:predicted  nucleic acid-binding Zn-ribbon protein